MTKLIEAIFHDYVAHLSFSKADNGGVVKYS
jgi:hypothetical protein